MAVGRVGPVQFSLDAVGDCPENAGLWCSGCLPAGQGSSPGARYRHPLSVTDHGTARFPASFRGVTRVSSFLWRNGESLPPKPGLAYCLPSRPVPVAISKV